MLSRSSCSRVSAAVRAGAVSPCLPWLAGVLVAMSTLPPASAAERVLRLTVYNNDLALVSDARTLELPAGRGTIELADVPARIDPTSVHFKALRGRALVLEQNFQYDLADADRILQRYLDSPIEVVLKDGGDLKSGTLLSFDGGSIVLRGAGGAVSLVSRAQVVDLRLPKLPEGLRTRPTLVWWLQSDGGATPVELSYLTSGMSWHAEYVAVTNEADTAIDLSAWVSLENSSGASYPEAKLQLIAGDVQRVLPPQPTFDKVRRMSGAVMAELAAPGFEEESFFEYHLYTLERPTTIADRETKQITLFPTASGPVKKIYEYDGQRDAKKVRVILETENKKELGLGMPLPAGKVRVYKKDSRGDLQFVGEDMIDHTPRNEKIRLGVGKAFDIAAERNVLSSDRITDRIHDQKIEVKVRNRKEEKIEVLVIDHFWGDWEIRESSVPGNQKDAYTAEFRLDVPADQEVVLTYTVRTRY